MLTNTVENYLKVIYTLEKECTNTVSTSLIAESIAIKASSVTDMLKKMADKELIQYQKYKGVKLTDYGRKEALKIIRRQRIWECFLVDVLDFSWEEVHEIAEQLEHVNAPKLIDKLDGYLGFPTHDPHGDPIPDSEGNLTLIARYPLAEVAEGQRVEMIAVKDTSDAFLKYLNHKNIAIGTVFEITHIESYDNSRIIKVGEKEIMITHEVAENIFIKVIQ